MNDDTLKPSEGFDYYAPETVFFNTFDIFADQWNELISGNSDMGWMDHLLLEFGKFERALFVSCGNGWVERDCFQAGLIGHATGFDILPELLETARTEAAKIGMPSTYSVEDGNKINLPKDGYNLVVNNGACHHIAFLDRLLREVHGALAPDGLYVIIDYTGPHRNQYSWTAWEQIIKSNATLPEEYRTALKYPHMPTMLALDPTEAIHSELQLDLTARYFDFEQHVALGGGLVHQLLFGSAGLLANQHSDANKLLLEGLLKADVELTRTAPETNLFTFAICRPKGTSEMPSQEQLDAWTEEEIAREANAEKNNGRYYPANALELLYHQHALETTSLSHQISARVLERDAALQAALQQVIDSKPRAKAYPVLREQAYKIRDLGRRLRGKEKN
ncbi:class I SAM-dependent methyltransferase [uncultured Ruegeria sp.]|uniref:class I SAM-dependent methyltransferase n=1 Tax=uncultured Ruegeria sp. TaxID=259304 RepID=UPI002608A204|nr:class I SAM-dependent methyltransferase [uncultured Ruegeria sp.]